MNKLTNTKNNANILKNETENDFIESDSYQLPKMNGNS